MITNFETYVDRDLRYSAKWTNARQHLNSEDLFPFSVADMEFQSPNSIRDALKKTVDHGMYGYSNIPESCYQSIVDWVEAQYDWKIYKEWIVITSGADIAVQWAIQICTKPHESVVLQTPIYYQLVETAFNSERNAVTNVLLLNNNSYEIDFYDLEHKLQKPETKLLVLCNPHNPVGRVWTQDELNKIGDLALSNQVSICSDDVHSDIIYKEHTYRPLSTISRALEANTITILGPGKTFNFSGLKTAIAIIPNPEHRKKFKEIKSKSGLGSHNLFGIIAVETAYLTGNEWLKELIKYLSDNFKALKSFVDRYLPEVSVIHAEGSYLAWLDFRKINPNDLQLHNTFSKFGVFLSPGSTFGIDGTGFMRLNFACPRLILEKALHQMAKALR